MKDPYLNNNNENNYNIRKGYNRNYFNGDNQKYSNKNRYNNNMIRNNNRNQNNEKPWILPYGQNNTNIKNSNGLRTNLFQSNKYSNNCFKIIF